MKEEYNSGRSSSSNHINTVGAKRGDERRNTTMLEFLFSATGGESTANTPEMKQKEYICALLPLGG